VARPYLKKTHQKKKKKGWWSGSRCRPQVQATVLQKKQKQKQKQTSKQDIPKEIYTKTFRIVKGKTEMLKLAREKQHISNRGTVILVIVDFSSETRPERNCTRFSSAKAETEELSTQNPVPRISFRNEGDILNLKRKGSENSKLYQQKTYHKIS
jgi:hypothetical protein